MPAPRPEVRLDTSLEMLIEHAPAAHLPRVLATVVATAGSTYRKPGARMLILADGRYVGLLSGGCLEADLALHAEQVMQSGSARAIEYDMRGPDDILFGIGAGCEGAMRVLLEPAAPGSAAHAALNDSAQRARRGESSVLICVHESAHGPLGTYAADRVPDAHLRAASTSVSEARASRSLELSADSGRTRALLQFMAPPPHLLICGAGPDAQPVCAAARALGWRVTVVDHREHYAAARNFPGAEVRRCDPTALAQALALDRCHAAVVMSHHLLSDAAYLRSLAQAAAPGYVGLLGPAARRARLAEEVGALLEHLKPRLHGPVGLDIGAVTPEGIALSIITQIHAWLAGRPEADVAAGA